MSTADSRSEYSQVSTTRHEHASRSRSSRIRVSYFGAASFWGFVVGSLAVLGGLQAEGMLTTSPGFDALLYMIPAALLAIVGGFVIARAYREAKRGR